jgi:hypothetical protein
MPDIAHADFFNGTKKMNLKITFFRKGKKGTEKDSSGLTKLKKAKRIIINRNFFPVYLFLNLNN